MSSIPSSRPARSLAARLTLWYTVAAFSVVLASTAYLYWALGRNLDREDDEFLADQIHILRGLLRDRPLDDSGIKQEVEWESSVRQYARVYIRILDEDGRTLAETPGMGELLPPGLFPTPVPAVAAPKAGSDVESSGGKSFRTLSARADVGRGGRSIRSVQVALDREEEKELLADFRVHILPLLGVSLMLSAFVGYRIARRGTRPVEEIAETAKRIRSTTLHERIRTAELPAELSALAGTLNEMLDRIEESFERLSRFSADIAHELRTPLGNLTGEVEVALGRDRTPAEYRGVLESCLEEAARLTRLVESLLFLARAEKPDSVLRTEAVDVGRELLAIRDFYEAAAVEAGIELRTNILAELPGRIDRTLFQRAIGNLLENALVYSPEGGVVTLSALREDGYIRIEVADTGRGIAPEHLPHVFDRFYRADRSRTAATGGAGLGLAIVKTIGALHGGTVEISSEVGKGTRVALRLPMEMMTKT